MKTEKDIEKLAERQYPKKSSISVYDEGCRNGFFEGYSRCQEDTAELYSKIENLIIIWSNDGTKTAGTLTRQIMKLLNKDNEK